MAFNALCARCGWVVVSDGIRVGRSPPQHLLHSNSPPNWLESERARDAIKESQRNIALLDAEINNANTALTSLLAKRKELEHHVYAHKATLAQLRQLPAELLSEIFVLCLPPFPSDISTSAAPLLLERVCQRWRDIARSTPELWSYMKFSLQSKAVKFEVAMAMSWLPRSGRYPLSIALGTQASYDWPQETHPILDLLFPHCERWFDVNLNLTDDMMKSFTAVKGRLPLLKSLDLPMMWGGGGSWIMDSFKYAPKLRSFGMGIFMSKDAVQVPWKNLTKLSTRITDASEVRKILQECPNLLECKIGWVGDNQMYAALPHIRLARLHSLDIETVVTEPPDAFIASLDLPVLRQIRFTVEYVEDIGYHWNSGSSSVFVSFLSRSGYSLRTLALQLNQVSCEPVFFKTCLAAVPLLVDLELRGDAAGVLSDKILGQLTHRGSGVSKLTCVLPMLETLKIDYPHFGTVPDRPFAEMVESRWRLGQPQNPSLARLHTVHFHFVERKEHEDSDNFDFEYDPPFRPEF